MKENITNEWKNMLERFQQCVDKSVEVIHQEKLTIEKMRRDIFDGVNCGRMISDPERIVLSAPEIVIGNVNNSGSLTGASRIVLRGTVIDVEGSSEAGRINMKAPVIRSTAVDPGIDGKENVVYRHSAIVERARGIIIDSQDATGVFNDCLDASSSASVRIHSDRALDIEAAVSSAERLTRINTELDSISQEKSTLTAEIARKKDDVDSILTNIQGLIDREGVLNGNDVRIRTNMVDTEELRVCMEELMGSLYSSTASLIDSISQLAESGRRESVLRTEKGRVKAGKDFTTESTGASIMLKGERIGIACRDGDNNLRTNVGAGIDIRTPHMGISMAQDNGVLVKGSDLGIASERVAISTANRNTDGTEISASGEVKIASKSILLESMDYKKQDKLFTEKGLAADGKVSIAAKTIEVSAAKPADVKRDDTGKITNGNYTAEGDIILRSKNVSVETVDYEISNGKPKTKGVAKDSKMLLLSETVTLGKETDDFKSKKIDATTEEMTVTAENKLTAKLKSIEMSSDKINLSSSGNEVKGKTEFKDAVQGTELTMNKVEAKSSFKSMNIQDGM